MSAPKSMAVAPPERSAAPSLLLLGVGFLLPEVLGIGVLLRTMQEKNWSVARTTLALLGIVPDYQIALKERVPFRKA